MSRYAFRLLSMGILAILLIAAVLPGATFAADRDEPARVRAALEVSAPVTPFVWSGDVRNLPAPRRWKPGDPVKEIPRRAYIDPDQKLDLSGADQGIDRLLDVQSAIARAAADRAFTAPDRNFPGQGFSGVNPPDTVGDVGPNHYIQMINDSAGATVVIYDKALPTPNVLASFTLDQLVPSTGSCDSGLGDPIVIYDRFADRWMLSEFSSSGNQLCMYISQTSDPVSGGWFFYGFTAPAFPDYPKYGVWPTDANGGQGSYIVTTNESGSGVYAMERAAMLSGAPTTFQRFLIADLPGFSFNAVTPADLDGPYVPPTGSPAVIMRQRDTEVHSGPPAPEDVLEIWHYDVDWITTTNTTLTQLPDIDVAEFESDLCGLTAFACFPQPGTSTTLDPLREVVMNRLQYQNFQDHETLAGNFVTDVDGTDHGGLRWFELRRVGGISAPWTLFQEGTFAPDADHRWMAASAMDQSGNFAIAYNVSSTSTFPSLRFTGRLVDDPLGTLSQPETSIVAGAASNSSNRYGDYSAMNLDPEDDCTFWFTGEFNETSSWSTQIASFRFDACGCDLFPLPLTLSGGNNGDNRIDLAWNDSELDLVIEYRVQRSRTMGGPYTTIATIADTSPGTGNGAGYTYSDTTVSGGVTYYYVVRASDGGACTSDVSNEITETATGICLLAPLFAGLQNVATPNSGICTLNLDWNAAIAECDGPISYDVFRSTIPGFVPMPADRIATGVSGTSYSDLDELVSGDSYYYVVRAVDDSNLVSETNTVEVEGVPLGNLQPPLFVDDAGDSGSAQLTPSAPWSVQPSGGNSGPSVYQTGDYGDNTCADLTTPAIALGTNNVLEFWSRYEIENSWDKGEVQISTDGGASWVRLEVGYPGSSTQTSDACGLPTGDYFTGTNTSWALYSGDLSPWNGQTVQIRWLMSSDGSVTDNGWFIDDIAIVNNAASCATASSCPENPIVDVQPDGPLDACSLTIPALSADLSGGTGPFTYQWYQNGVPISGETAATFQPTDAGVHDYNVRVQAQACPDDVADGQPTQLNVESAARFGGVVSASDQGATTCGIDVAWNAATSICPGPLAYNVYRSTSASVSSTPGDLLVSGLTGTGYSDVVGLASGTPYYYLVQAVELSTGTLDGNAVVESTAAYGPDVVVFSDDAGDTGSAQLAPKTPWTVDLIGGNTGPNVYATGDYGDNTCADLEAPAIALTSRSQLSFWSRSEIENSYDKGEVQVSVDGGTTWDRVEVGYPGTSTNTSDNCGLPTGDYFTGDDPAWAEYVGDLSAWAGQNALLRWQMSTDGSVTDLGWWVDDISVTAGSTCEAGAAGPAPAPDGRNSTSPLQAELLDTTGDTLQVSWDTASCTAADYNLVYGDLANVAAYVLDGADCALGTSGNHTWNSVPSGSVFFLVVGTDGAGVESSWGVDGIGLERNGAAASGLCTITLKDATGTCP